MGFQLLGFTHSAVAAVDLSGSYGCAVVLDSTGKTNLPAAGGKIVGVNLQKPIAGQEHGYQFLGVAECKLGGTVAVDDPVKVDANGRFVTASPTDVANGAAVGLCLEGGSINQYGSVMLMIAATGFASAGGEDVIALGTTAPSNKTAVTFVTIDGTKTGVLAAGLYPGQVKDIIVSVAANTPVGTITGTFLSVAGAAEGTLNLDAVSDRATFVWTGAAWRAIALVACTLSA